MKSLDLQMAGQEQTEWCWAAVGVSLDQFYDRDSLLTQCGFASTVFDPTNCCADKAGCNEPHDLADALRKINRLEQEIHSSLPPAAIKESLDSQKPVAVGIAWFRGGAHFVVIDGYDEELDLVSVRDPDRKRGDAVLPFDEFTGNYANAGQWVATYLTRDEKVEQ